jgi:predicted dehydrogenase
VKEKLRVGVIGAGRWSTTAHLPGFTRSPLSEVVVLCDIDREMAEKKAKMFNIPEIETDYEKVLSRRDLDVETRGISRQHEE